MITIEGPPALAEFVRFTLKVVCGFEQALSGWRCLTGGQRWRPLMNVPTPVPLPAGAACVYVFGRSSHGPAHDIHLPLIPAPGERVVVPLTIATPEKKAALARLTALLEAASWRFAHTYADFNPHWWSARRTWDDADFVWAVDCILALGGREKFNGAWYTTLDLGQSGQVCHYWGMGHSGASPLSSVINRKPLPPDAVASTVRDQTLRAEDARLLPIPELPDGWCGLPAAVTTDKHFQAGVHLFGYQAPVDRRPRLIKNGR